MTEDLITVHLLWQPMGAAEPREKAIEVSRAILSEPDQRKVGIALARAINGAAGVLYSARHGDKVIWKVAP